jgi:hypothetical protein
MVGSHFTLDLMVDSGSHTVAGQQSYLTFTHQLLQNVQLSPTSCISSSTVTGDFATFDAQLQNQVCNGPGNCTFGGNTVPPGSIAFASGALNNPPASGEFRVARISFCSTQPGTAHINWQFSPPAPPNRNTKITDELSQTVSDPALYQNYVVHVVERELVGHVTWQGRPPQPHPLQQLPITLTLDLDGQQYNYPNMTTDSSGSFTPTLGTLPNGTYQWWAKGPQYLANSGTITMTGQPDMQVEMGLMRAGDANNDNVTDITDFTILRATFGRSCGDTGFDGRADFNGDCTVDITDFTLLRANFGSSGAPPLEPQGPQAEASVTPVPPANGQAYLELRPGTGAPPKGGQVKVGSRFTLELWLHPGSGAGVQVVGQQSYLSFTRESLQNVKAGPKLASCEVSNTVAAHLAALDAQLQNEVCNGPQPCTFRGIETSPGSIAFASGALSNPPVAGKPVKVGEIRMCAVAPGDAGLRWEFSPSAPTERNTGITDANGNWITNRERFTDYLFKVVSGDK